MGGEAEAAHGIQVTAGAEVSEHNVQVAASSESANDNASVANDGDESSQADLPSRASSADAISYIQAMGGEAEAAQGVQGMANVDEADSKVAIGGRVGLVRSSKAADAVQSAAGPEHNVQVAAGSELTNDTISVAHGVQVTAGADEAESSVVGDIVRSSKAATADAAQSAAMSVSDVQVAAGSGFGNANARVAADDEECSQANLSSRAASADGIGYIQAMGDEATAALGAQARPDEIGYIQAMGVAGEGRAVQKTARSDGGNSSGASGDGEEGQLPRGGAPAAGRPTWAELHEAEAAETDAAMRRRTARVRDTDEDGDAFADDVGLESSHGEGDEEEADPRAAERREYEAMLEHVRTLAEGLCALPVAPGSQATAYALVYACQEEICRMGRARASLM